VLEFGVELYPCEAKKLVECELLVDTVDDVGEVGVVELGVVLGQEAEVFLVQD
jgi:hypothetical protein